MVYQVPIDEAKVLYSEFDFVRALAPSAQKAAFHVRRDGRDLCLKVISPNYETDRVHREILAMRKIQHPNVVKVLEYEFSAKGECERHYLIEEFIEGADLSELIVEDNPWPIDQLVAFFVPLLSGLDELRKNEIVHRDLKPSNIRVRVDGSPVIIDFGLARHLDLPSITNTAFGAGLGTPKYFAPEQFHGTKRDIEHRTDLFAVGVMMYEAAVGRHPSFSQQIKTIDQLADAVCDSGSWKHDDRFNELPDRIQLIIKRMLAKSRSQRPNSAELAARMLRLGGD